jgi:shikimate dehydrogenase
MHNAAYEALGLDWVYLPLAVSDEIGLRRFAAAARSLPFVGFNVTMPYKQAMLELCDEVATMARMAGAVNTVHVVDGNLIGYNTDGRGLLESIESVGFSCEGKSAVIYGAGGAAGAAFVALVLAKVARITVVNRSAENADDLLDRMSQLLRQTEASHVVPEGAEEWVRSADLVVNATPVGMKADDPSPVPPEWISSGQVVCDMVYRAQSTGLVRAAQAVGATALDGLGMLVGQGATAIDIWNESAQIRTPRDVMRDAAHAALAARETPEGVPS